MMLKKQTLTKHDFERKKDNREKMKIVEVPALPFYHWYGYSK